MAQWTIQSLTTPTKFEGLGQLKNTILPSETRVLMSGETILAIPGVSGGQSTSLNTKTNKFILEAFVLGIEVRRVRFLRSVLRRF